MRAGPRGVAYVSYDGLLEPLGATQVVPYVEGLARIGFPMGVISFEKPADLRDAGRVEAMESRLAAAGVRWSRRRYHARPSLPGTAWDMAAGVRALWDEGRNAPAPPRLVHARSYVAGVMGLLARRRLGASLLLDMRGFWVDERLESGRWRPGSALVHLARRFERELLVGSDHIVHLTRRAAAGVGELIPGGRLPPGTVIPTCVDLDRFRPADDPRARRRELGLPPGPLVVHTGTLSGWYLGTQTVRVGGALARLTGGAFLVLTRERDLAERLLAAEGVDALVRTAHPEDVPRWLGAADAGLALVRTGFAKSASAPTKVGEYLACGLAVAATAVGDLREQLDGGAAFTVADDAEPEEVARRLAAAAARPDRVREARALAATHFSLEEGVARYADIYRSLGVRPCA